MKAKLDGAAQNADTDKKDATNENADAAKSGDKPAIAAGSSVQDGKPGKVRGDAGTVRRGDAKPTARNARSSAGKDAGPDYIPAAEGLTRTGSWFETAKRNIDLIQLAIQIDKEKRSATPQEQDQLAKYVGFGASAIRNDLFPIPPEYAKKQDPNRLIWPNMVRDAKWKPLPSALRRCPWVVAAFHPPVNAVRPLHQRGTHPLSVGCSGSHGLQRRQCV